MVRIRWIDEKNVPVVARGTIEVRAVRSEGPRRATVYAPVNAEKIVRARRAETRVNPVGIARADRDLRKSADRAVGREALREVGECQAPIRRGIEPAIFPGSK